MRDNNPNDGIRKAALRSTAEVNESSAGIETKLVTFRADDTAMDLNFDFHAETIWATYNQMAGLFGCTVENVILHVNDVFKTGEVSQAATTKDFLVVQREGKRRVERRIKHFNLDVILSVGYRVDSARAIKFRQWSTQILKAYVTEGFALNETRLRQDAVARENLARRVRALRERAQEIEDYAVVRDCFVMSACDYDPQSPLMQMFMARLQNVFHFAITKRTAAEIVLDRARYQLPNMGLISAKPTMNNAKVAKNYLTEQELRRYRILSSHFTLFVEERAMRGEETTMRDLLDQFTRMLKAGEYPTLGPSPRSTAKRAERHAQAQFAMWSMRQKQISDKRPSS